MVISCNDCLGPRSFFRVDPPRGSRPNNPGARSESTDFGSWIAQQPPAALTFTILRAAITLLVNFRFIPLSSVLLANGISEIAKVWKLLTASLYSGPNGLQLVVNMMIFFQMCSQLELTNFRRREDMAYVIIVLAAACTLGGLPFDILAMGGALDISLVTLSCSLNPNMIYRIFMMNIPAAYAPFAFMGMSFIVAGRIPTDEIIGYAAGKFFHYLYSDPRNSRYVRTPDMIRPLLVSLTSMFS